MSDPPRCRPLIPRATLPAGIALAVALAAALLEAAPPAGAEADQFSFSADRMETVLAEGRERTVLTGNAALTSDDTEIFADSIELYGDDLAFALSRGGVRVVQVGEGIELTSETVFYNRRDGIVRVEGDALLVDHDNEMVIRGGFLEHWEDRNETSIQIGVQILSDDLVARAQLVHYDRGKQTLALSGLPVVTWKGDEYRASRVFIDLDQDRIVLTGAVSGQITPLLRGPSRRRAGRRIHRHRRRIHRPAGRWPVAGYGGRPVTHASGRTATLAVEGLTKRYGRKYAARDVSFSMGSGEVVGLLGPNGAGKTTVFYLIVGFIRPTAGRIFLTGDEITRLPMFRRARAGISYLPQEPSVFRKLTVEQNLLAVLETQRGLSRSVRRQRCDEILDALGLEDLRRQRAYTLSGGERRRTEIGRALAMRPSFLLLDEPFAGIDPIAVQDIKGIVGRLAEAGIGVLITDHNVRDTLEITHRSYILRAGEIMVSGTRDELVENQLARRLYLGRDFRL